MTKGEQYILLPGDVSWVDEAGVSKPTIEPRIQHLSCFAGGMVGLGAKVFDHPEDLSVARKLVDGCIWGYENGRLGIMPEIMHTVACEDRSSCRWDEERWHREMKEMNDEKNEVQHLPPGVSKIDDGRYILRYFLMFLFS